jgi:alkaline phosphatase
MDDGLPLPTITYSNGPGWFNAYIVDGSGNVARRDLTGDDVTSLDYVKPAGANRLTATHGGEDVALYAVGEKALRDIKHAIF